MESAVSPIEAINAAIQSSNPFSNTKIVREDDVWGKGFPDVTTLNKHASDAVFAAIKQVKTSQSSQDKVTSIAITASLGVGKSHIISRIRHRLEREGGTLFVYASVNKYTDLNLIKYQFQQTLAESLKHTGSQGVMQWQEVATAMVNEVGGVKSQISANLVSKFDKAYKSSLAQNQNLMNSLQKQILRAKPNLDRYIVRAVLWTLSQDYATAAINWLSGKELSQAEAEYLGLPNSSKTSQDREAEALNTILQILNLVGYYNPVLICFDEIDVKNNANDDGLPTEQVIANLVKILHDTLMQSEVSQGVVILTVMQPDTWTNKVNSMLGGIPDRISKYTQRKPIALDYLNSKSMVELVTLWLKEFYEQKNLIPPHPVYPFEEKDLKEYGKKKASVREALQWCAENFKVYTPPLPDEPLERFELALKNEIEAEIGNYLENNELIYKSIYLGFETLKGKTLEGVTIEELVNEVKPRAKNNGWINFKIIGNQNGKVVKIGVAVIQSNLFGLVAGLKRLTDYKTYDLTRGCLVRSKSETEKIKKNSESYRLLDLLRSKELGGEYVELKEEEIRPLIAIRAVCRKCRDYNLTEEQVFDFVCQKQLTFENLLLREILSDPSGEIDGVVEEDDDPGKFLNLDNIDDESDDDPGKFLNLDNIDDESDDVVGELLN
ncbi:MAG TPA: hypothetical protein DDW76_25740 [Cyanobacteria bacterium UBA11369]|nr:hypothetical protein [Cyanobacteria bacterium UBA11371]HBE32446.1 hypothetical protein [Cyanobacteria bacterium UBA11368]HBE52080.1 hypothetical protein [Cyanobacteria bacterium UBA11369]